MRPGPSRLCLLAGLAAAALTLPGCAGQASREDRGPLVRVTERDFRIAVGRSSGPAVVSSGNLRLAVHNRGPETHELLVVRVDGSRLPLRADGLTVDESAVKARTVGSLDGGPPGGIGELHLHLAPGRYVLFCNMAGHYLGGMHTDLVAR